LKDDQSLLNQKVAENGLILVTLAPSVETQSNTTTTTINAHSHSNNFANVLTETQKAISTESISNDVRDLSIEHNKMVLDSPKSRTNTQEQENNSSKMNQETDKNTYDANLSFKRNLEMLIMMGFASEDAEQALKMNENQMEKTATFLSQRSSISVTNTTTSHPKSNPNTTQTPSESSYSFASQLEKLLMMGFDKENSTRVLRSTNGNVDLAISKLSESTNVSTNPISKTNNISFTSQLENLLMMGFDKENATRALLSTNGDVDLSISKLSESTNSSVGAPLPTFSSNSETYNQISPYNTNANTHNNGKLNNTQILFSQSKQYQEEKGNELRQ
jgi:Holliday junction resolvasome RuvABC DNA-binding subunit